MTITVYYIYIPQSTVIHACGRYIDWKVMGDGHTIARLLTSATLGPVRGDPYTRGRVDGGILLILTLTVEQSICTVNRFRSFQLTGLSLLFKAAPCSLHQI